MLPWIHNAALSGHHRMDMSALCLAVWPCTLQPRSMAEYRRHLIEPGTKDYTFLRMETRAYEFLLCW